MGRRDSFPLSLSRGRKQKTKGWHEVTSLDSSLFAFYVAFFFLFAFSLLFPFLHFHGVFLSFEHEMYEPHGGGISHTKKRKV